MNLMHSNFCTAGKFISLIVIEDSYPLVMSSGVTKSHFRKARANIVKMLSELQESQNGGFEGYDEKYNWTHKSYLRELAYAKVLILPHKIDLMHQEQNIVKSIISMCFDVTGFLKENVNARKDLPAPYWLKLVERKDILRWLKKLKFLDRYAFNIKGAVNVSTGKVNELKSQDYHIILERLMPVMSRCYFDADLWKIFAELSYFYRHICAKQLSKAIM
jgi:hypothetical protein